MSDVTETQTKTSHVPPKTPAGSEMDPVVVDPGSEADPSTKPEWGEHVKEYFNQDATSGEPIPTASHEAKE